MKGQTLGPYRIIDKIGRGGMATVFKAYHATMDRNVAIKILPEHMAEVAGFRERFEREAKVVAKLQHPHILPVFDYGVDGDTSYLVMPYVPSGDLKHYIRNGPHPLEEVADIFNKLAGALDYAHERGILHRDIKPDNILFDASQNPLLSDFGLTRMTEGSNHLTGSAVIGTPSYMSPEQGQGKEIDHRSDIYSMGILLYEMVTGYIPFSADTPVAVIFKHVSEPLPMPQDKRPDLPDAAQNVILKALSKEPDDRYDSCMEMATAFTDAISNADKDYVPVVPAPEMGEPSEILTPTLHGKITQASSDRETQIIEGVAPKPRKSKPRSNRPMVIGGIGIAIAVILTGIVILMTDTSTAEFAGLEPTPTPITATLDASQLELAGTPVSANDDWTPYELELNGGTMVLVPAGCFMMGSDTGDRDERPIHEQCFEEPFWIHKYEVTNARFAHFLNENPNGNTSPDGFAYFDAGNRNERIRNLNGRWEVSPEFSNHPMVEVTWFGARDYCKWLGEEDGFRLPTEREWEYAARGPDNLTFPWGNEWDEDLVVWRGNSDGQTAEVGSIESGSSWVGAMDMSGNVWEWLSSLLIDHPYDASHEDEADTTSVRLLRGGSWDNNSSIDLRSADRAVGFPHKSNGIFGFRCVRSP